MNNFLNDTRGNVYYKIQNQPLSLSEREIVFSFDQARLDPRLMEVLVEFIRDYWWSMDSARFNSAVKNARFPFMAKAAAICVWNFCEASESAKNDFRSWMQISLRGIKNPNPQLLYIGLYRVGSKTMMREVQEAIPCLFKMGLIAKDLPFNKSVPGTIKEQSTMSDTVSDVEMMKSKLCAEIKKIKAECNLKNADIQRLSGFNRSFLSKTLNNKFENISAEYLNSRVLALRRAALLLER